MVGANAAALAALISDPMPAALAATATNASGAALTNDMRNLPTGSSNASRRKLARNFPFTKRRYPRKDKHERSLAFNSFSVAQSQVKNGWSARMYGVTRRQLLAFGCLVAVVG
ncbi:hypothetical protein MSIMFB_04551 [Mycobacterium simulans]|uniref:Uncharacterized protein n=1 Tax=Mycobacterium simulans TaxID=627089 RepID=A0A7Z7INV2_9MYCO|nr:hypothetical protein MSIMFB_04551 [Mycobacterium simulans]